MSRKNRARTYVENMYYHVFNRGVEKRIIFNDDDDKKVFLALLKRYLGCEPAVDPLGREYANYRDQVELLAYCLMPNHFHLLFYLKQEDGIRMLMHDVSTAYVRYFNDKYHRVGPLFQDRFKASLIIQESYLQHISRYIHLNPREWRSEKFSSLPYWLNEAKADWVHPERLLSMPPEKYFEFLTDYEDYKQTLDIVKADLAG